MDKSRESPPVAYRERTQKHPLHWQENLHHRGQYSYQNNKTYAWTACEVKENVVRVQGGHHVMVWWGGIPSGGDTSSFCTGARVYQEDMLQGVVKHLNMTLFSVQEWCLPAGLSSSPQGLDKWGVAAVETSGLHQCWDLALGECTPQTPGQ
jgi:hypothetical protein